MSHREIDPRIIAPAHLQRYFGRDDIVPTALAQLDWLIDHGSLAPDAQFLDVGCGIGRTAIALTTYLNNEGSYTGFDSFPFGVEWCREHITPIFPRFKFDWADVKNDFYSKYGNIDPADFVFPYEDESFDFIMANSVFTHMFPHHMLNYLKQMARVLKAGGKMLVTFFLLNDYSQKAMAEGKDVSFTFPVQVSEYCYSEHAVNIEGAMAYVEKYVQVMLDTCGLRLDKAIYGNWCGRKNTGTGQDIYIISRK